MDIQTLIETTERDVEAAAAVLDETMPGWPGRVDMERIDMEDPALCIAGQLDLWGSAGLAMRHHRLAFIWPPDARTDGAIMLLWTATATVTWWDEISKRTGEPTPDKRSMPEGFLPENIRALLVTP